MWPRIEHAHSLTALFVAVKSLYKQSKMRQRGACEIFNTLFPLSDRTNAVAAAERCESANRLYRFAGRGLMRRLLRLLARTRSNRPDLNGNNVLIDPATPPLIHPQVVAAPFYGPMIL